MRAELMEILPDYEQRLRRRSDALPPWLEIAPAQVRALFHLQPVPPDPSTPAQASPVHGILGPRTVALAAGHIEAFIERGFVDVDFDDPTRVRHLVELYLETTSYLNALIREARRVAYQARTTLDAWLDALLDELERQRKIDVEALEDLVSQGDIGRGRSARQEIADLWEEQRRVAAELQASWQPLSALVREGLASTESGLQELSGLLMRARAGLVGANAAFEGQLPPFVWPDAAPAPAAAPEPEPDEAGPTLDLRQPPEVGADKGAPGEAAGDASIDSASPDTLVPGQSAANPAPADRAVAPDEPAQTTLFEGDYVPGIIPLDEPASDPETPTLESSSVSDYSEPVGEDAGPTSEPAAPGRTSTQRMYTRAETPAAGHRAAPEPVERHRDPGPTRHTEPLPAPDDEPPAPGPETPRTSAPGAALLSDEATYTQCFRVRPGYARVGWLEVLGVTLPPALVLGTLAILSVLNLVGASFNPFERWSWAFSAAAAALAWLLLWPALRRWRSKWLGTRLVIMRHTDVREEAALRFDKQLLTLADTTLRWDRLSSAQLRRWDSPLDEVCGWTLSLRGPGAALLLATPEANRKKWQNSPYQLAETPYDAWQLSPFDFDTIVRRAL